jgi:hypothetical protein
LGWGRDIVVREGKMMKGSWVLRMKIRVGWRGMGMGRRLDEDKEKGW